MLRDQWISEQSGATGYDWYALNDFTAQYDRPQTRGDCVDGPRPCPWVGCRYHLYLDLTVDGTLKVPKHIEPEDMAVSCALDVAEDGERSLEAIGGLMFLDRESVRSAEVVALVKLRRRRRTED